MDNTHPHAVLSKLNEQRSQGLFCDVTIVVEDVKFRAHKNILAACSGYFRNTLKTSDTCTSGQVLELMDLKSEVFANILNFIYTSKVTSSGLKERWGLVAAGKRLGIPFLEKLIEQQDEFGKAAVPKPKKQKEKAPKPDDPDNSRGPRITNAFSITEVCPGSNPFTPLVKATEEKLSPEDGQLTTAFSTTSCISENNETSHNLFEHSYAVTKSMEGQQSCQWENRKDSEPAVWQSKALLYRNRGPLKKRHRLGGSLGRSILPMPTEQQRDKPNTVPPASNDISSTAPAVNMTPPALSSEAETEKQVETGCFVATNSDDMELGPPPLSPHPEDCISVYSCKRCPEIFSKKALLAIHSQVHTKLFAGNLFCKFCRRKFIHLKRLHNHERACPKAVRGQPNSDARDTVTKEVVEDGADIESDETRLPSEEDISNPDLPDHLQTNHLVQPQRERTLRLGFAQRRYNCSVCKRVYVNLSSLKRHENVHSWQRAYPCHYCNKVFALAEYRTKHEIWHTGERRYQCIFCLETFMTYYILKNHQKSFHGIDPNLSVRKKSANGGLKASVYPIKLYRLLPMKFREKQYKSYSKMYQERSDLSSLENNPLVPSSEGSDPISHNDTTSCPLTFMATTTMISPVAPRICFDKPSNQSTDQTLDTLRRKTSREVENKDTSLDTRDSIFLVQPNSDSLGGCRGDLPALISSEGIGQNLNIFNSLSTVKKLDQLAASAKRVEEMTKEILGSSTADQMHEKAKGTKTETYIAKPACRGPSLESDAMPLCQITVKIGNEAIIRRQIKGSKLFPKRKRKIRDLHMDISSSECISTLENPDTQRIRFKPEATTSAGLETYDETNEGDTADQLWRPYYSYKSKKKRKKLKYRHRKAYFHKYPEQSFEQTTTSNESHLDKTAFLIENNSSGGTKPIEPNRNYSPRTNYNCDICDSSFITETGLKAHVIGSHPCFCRTCGKQGPPGEAPAGGDYICRNCMENGSCFDNTPRSPNQEKKYCCSFCPQRFLYLATKKSHEKKHPEANNGGPKNEKFKSGPDHLIQMNQDNRQDSTKKEDIDQEGLRDIKHENTEEVHVSTGERVSKIKDRNESISINHDVSHSDVNSSLLSTPLMKCSQVTDKAPRTRISEHHFKHIIKKRPACSRDNDLKISMLGPRMTSIDHENSMKPFKSNHSEGNNLNISIQKPEEVVCKEEPHS